jgi:oxygen-dependent protoporphyrinogen oxidase
MTHVAIVGGGITGLATAHRLTGEAPDGLRVSVLEASERFGGVIRTRTFAGRRLDCGPEAMLAAVPHAPSLCRELGLANDLVAPVNDQPYVWTKGRLRRLPPRLLAGVPDGTRAVLASRLVSPLGLARAGFDLLAPSRPLTDDVSIGALVRRRLGGEVHEQLIAPLLGGIHAGDCDRLSVRATAPQLAGAIAGGHGLVRGLRAAARNAPAPSGPAFLTLEDGLEGLIAALVEALAMRAELRTGCALETIAPLPGEGFELSLSGGESLHADHVVLAVPAVVAARVLAGAAPAAAQELARIGYAAVATVALAYPAAAIRRALDGSGFLVPRGDRRLVTACTWCSAKWSHLAGDPVLLRASVGHSADERFGALSDAELIGAVHGELALALHITGDPLDALITRFPHALPQYTVGHLDLLERIETALHSLPGLRLAGAAYRGAGIGACIRDGEAAAREVIAALALETSR